MAKRVSPWNPHTADWLVAQRGRRTQDEIVAAMAERGVALKRAWLSRIENGAPFGADLLAAFEDFYGSVPPPHEPASAVGAHLPDAGSALLELAGAIRDLVEELRLSRAEQVEATDVTLRALGALGAGPAPRGTRVDTEREAHADTPAGTPGR